MTRKQKLVKQFKPNILRGTALNPNLSDAARYKATLDKLIERMTGEVGRELSKLFKTDFAKEHFAHDASISSQARILTNALIDKYNKLFASMAKPIADHVVSEVDKSSAIAVQSSLKALSGGLTLNTSALTPQTLEALSASVTENVALIKSISQQYLSGVQGAVMRSITTGDGFPGLIKYLESHKEITKRRARTIAYDQTRKAFNAINKGRMDRLGIKKFEWLHSGGSNHPRKDHIAMSGNIYDLNNPPVIGKMYGQEVRGIPGDLPNCWCRLLPVVEFNEE